MKNSVFTCGSVLIICVSLISHGQIITTFAGTGSSLFSGDGGPATAAGVPNPSGGVFDKYGNFYFGDAADSHRIRKIDGSGIVTTIAGNGSGGYGGDGGPATAAMLNRPIGPALDTTGNIYFVDKENNRIRKINITTGIITTIAGTGVGGYNGDGIAATSAQVYAPDGLTVDKYGNVYIADMHNHRVRKINSGGIITTIAGNGTEGFSGDDDQATNAQITYPTGVAVDEIGNVYIADWSSFSNRVRKVNPSGIITTVAGNGSGIYTGDGIPATSASIVTVGVAVKYNNLYITDRYNHRVYKVNLSSGILYCIAGNGVAGDSGDGGTATAASLNYPAGIAVDECANVYVATVGVLTIPGTGRRIRKITFNPPPCTYLSVSEQSVKKEVAIYPNPANEELHIENAQPHTTYQLYNIVGATVQGGLIAQGSTITIKHLPPGLYLLALTDEDGKRTVHKIVKE